MMRERRHLRQMSVQLRRVWRRIRTSVGLHWLAFSPTDIQMRDIVPAAPARSQGFGGETVAMPTLNESSHLCNLHV